MKPAKNKLLLGKRILITSPSLDRPMESALIKLGAKVIWQPAISIKPLRIDIKWKQYDFLVFSSANGVKYFFSNCIRNKIKPSLFQSLKICAIGVKTAKALEGFGLKADLIPLNYTSSALSAKLSKVLFKGAKILYPGANIRNKNISKAAKQKGANITTLNVYKIIHKKLRPTDANLVILTSASQVKATKKYINLKDKMLFSIGPETTREIRKLGLNAITAGEHTYDGIVKAILAYFRTGR